MSEFPIEKSSLDSTLSVSALFDAVFELKTSNGEIELVKKPGVDLISGFEPTLLFYKILQNTTEDSSYKDPYEYLMNIAMEKNNGSSGIFSEIAAGITEYDLKVTEYDLKKVFVDIGLRVSYVEKDIGMSLEGIEKLSSNQEMSAEQLTAINNFFSYNSSDPILVKAMLVDKGFSDSDYETLIDSAGNIKYIQDNFNFSFGNANSDGTIHIQEFLNAAWSSVPVDLAAHTAITLAKIPNWENLITSLDKANHDGTSSFSLDKTMLSLVDTIQTLSKHFDDFFEKTADNPLSLKNDLGNSNLSYLSQFLLIPANDRVLLGIAKEHNMEIQKCSNDLLGKLKEYSYPELLSHVIQSGDSQAIIDLLAEIKESPLMSNGQYLAMTFIYNKKIDAASAEVQATQASDLETLPQSIPAIISSEEVEAITDQYKPSSIDEGTGERQKFVFDDSVYGGVDTAQYSDENDTAYASYVGDDTTQYSDENDAVVSAGSSEEDDTIQVVDYSGQNYLDETPIGYKKEPMYFSDDTIQVVDYSGQNDFDKTSIENQLEEPRFSPNDIVFELTERFNQIFDIENGNLKLSKIADMDEIDEFQKLILLDDYKTVLEDIAKKQDISFESVKSFLTLAQECETKISNVFYVNDAGQLVLSPEAGARELGKSINNLFNAFKDSSQADLLQSIAVAKGMDPSLSLHTQIIKVNGVYDTISDTFDRDLSGNIVFSEKVKPEEASAVIKNILQSDKAEIVNQILPHYFPEKADQTIVLKQITQLVNLPADDKEMAMKSQGDEHQSPLVKIFSVLAVDPEAREIFANKAVEIANKDYGADISVHLQSNVNKNTGPLLMAAIQEVLKSPEFIQKNVDLIKDFMAVMNDGSMVSMDFSVLKGVIDGFQTALASSGSQAQENLFNGLYGAETILDKDLGKLFLSEYQKFSVSSGAKDLINTLSHEVNAIDHEKIDAMKSMVSKSFMINSEGEVTLSGNLNAEQIYDLKHMNSIDKQLFEKVISEQGVKVDLDSLLNYSANILVHLNAVFQLDGDGKININMNPDMHALRALYDYETIAPDALKDILASKKIDLTVLDKINELVKLENVFRDNFEKLFDVHHGNPILNVSLLEKIQTLEVNMSFKDELAKMSNIIEEIGKTPGLLKSIAQGVGVDNVDLLLNSVHPNSEKSFGMLMQDISQNPLMAAIFIQTAYEGRSDVKSIFPQFVNKLVETASSNFSLMANAQSELKGIKQWLEQYQEVYEHKESDPTWAGVLKGDFTGFADALNKESIKSIFDSYSQNELVSTVFGQISPEINPKLLDLFIENRVSQDSFINNFQTGIQNMEPVLEIPKINTETEDVTSFNSFPNMAFSEDALNLSATVNNRMPIFASHFLEEKLSDLGLKYTSAMDGFNNLTLSSFESQIMIDKYQALIENIKTDDGLNKLYQEAVLESKQAVENPLSLNEQGLYDISNRSTLTLDFHSMSSNAGYVSSFGFYYADANGNPITGKLLDANVQEGQVGDNKIDLQQAPEGAVSIGYFIIPNGAMQNELSDDGEVSFKYDETSGWSAWMGETRLSSASESLFYSDSHLNSDGLSHLKVESNANGTTLGWEDLAGGGDQDYDDIVVSLNVTTPLIEQLDPMTVFLEKLAAVPAGEEGFDTAQQWLSNFSDLNNPMNVSPEMLVTSDVAPLQPAAGYPMPEMPPATAYVASGQPAAGYPMPEMSPATAYVAPGQPMTGYPMPGMPPATAYVAPGQPMTGYPMPEMPPIAIPIVHAAPVYGYGALVDRIKLDSGLNKLYQEAMLESKQAVENSLSLNEQGLNDVKVLTEQVVDPMTVFLEKLAAVSTGDSEFDVAQQFIMDFRNMLMDPNTRQAYMDAMAGPDAAPLTLETLSQVVADGSDTGDLAFLAQEFIHDLQLQAGTQMPSTMWPTGFDSAGVAAPPITDVAMPIGDTTTGTPATDPTLLVGDTTTLTPVTDPAMFATTIAPSTDPNMLTAATTLFGGESIVYGTDATVSSATPMTSFILNQDQSQAFAANTEQFNAAQELFRELFTGGDSSFVSQVQTVLSGQLETTHELKEVNGFLDKLIDFRSEHQTEAVTYDRAAILDKLNHITNPAEDSTGASASGTEELDLSMYITVPVPPTTHQEDNRDTSTGSNLI